MLIASVDTLHIWSNLRQAWLGPIPIWHLSSSWRRHQVAVSTGDAMYVCVSGVSLVSKLRTVYGKGALWRSKMRTVEAKGRSAWKMVVFPHKLPPRRSVLTHALLVLLEAAVWDHDLSEMPPVPSSCILYGPGLGVTHHRQSLLSSCCRGVRKLSFTRRCCVVWGESEYQRNLFLSLWKHYWTQSY